MPTDAPPQHTRSAPSIVGVAGVALCVHALLRLLLDPHLYGSDAARASLRLAAGFPGIVVHALVAAYLAAGMIARGRPGARIGAGLLLATAVAGWPWLKPSLLAPHSSLLWIVVPIALGDSLANRMRSPRSTASGVVMIVVGLAAVLLPVRLLGPSMERREVVRAVLGDLEALEVHRAHESVGPRAGVLCPSPDPALDGADMPSLVLSPPAEISLRITEEDGPCLLSTAAGISHLVEDHMLAPGDSLAVDFEVEVSGHTVFSERLTVTGGDPVRGSEWRSVGEEPVFLRPGDVVTLRTRLPEGANAVVPENPVPAGFREMLLERRVVEPRALATPEAPSIVFVLQDTLRRDRLSTYGYERETSPALDRLAERGVVFDEAYTTSSWTWPSTASLLTGLLPHEHGVVDDGSPFLDHGLDTLAEELQRQGYTTAAFSGNPLIAPGKNFGQGFETFVVEPRGFQSSTTLMPDALAWMRRNAGLRTFLYLHLVDAHEPHRPLDDARERFAPTEPEGFDARTFLNYADALLARDGHTPDGASVPERVVPEAHARYLSDLYDACVATADHWLGEVVAELEALGLSDRTLVVFTSDHGEELLDHGLYAHGQSLHGELTRAPLVVAGPGVPAGERVDVPVSNRHLAPTLAHYAGGALRGVSDPLDLLALDSLEARPLLLSTTHGWWNGHHRTPVHAFRDGAWIVHFAPDAGPFGAQRSTAGFEQRLYRLDRDPAEVADRSGEFPFRADELRERAERWIERLEERRTSPAFAAGEATLEMLRGVGYLGDEEDTSAQRP